MDMAANMRAITAQKPDFSYVSAHLSPHLRIEVTDRYDYVRAASRLISVRLILHEIS